MGFTPQIEMILKFVPKDHQTLLFSATLPQNILRISDRYLNKPERISTGATSVPIAKIKQETLQVFKENKYDELIDQFLARKGSILVFVKTKRSADKMVKKLKEELSQLKDIERPKASQAIADARDKGDLSENAEYDAAKEAQGMLEMRIFKA